MFYKIARIVCRFILFLRRWDLSGLENMPVGDGVIVAANHTSYWDPVIIGCSFGRRVSYMGKEELFNINPVFTWIIRQLGCFPVKRGKSDREAIKTALRHLNSGEAVGVFPEGGIARPGNSPQVKTGISFLALKSGVPILPVGITGAGGLGRVVVRVGKPITVPEPTGGKTDKEALTELTERVMQVIDNLTKQQDLP